MIYHMKVYMIFYNYGSQKNVKIQNSNFAFLWTKGSQNGYSALCKKEIRKQSGFVFLSRFRDLKKGKIWCCRFFQTDHTVHRKKFRIPCLFELSCIQQSAGSTVQRPCTTVSTSHSTAGLTRISVAPLFRQTFVRKYGRGKV